ncbi:MAG: glycerate kinase [Spirochaetaceae bacterium]|jgi:glycerate kinase|nr:glycerate kinase [Spirochaetaceae bacterium]
MKKAVLIPDSFKGTMSSSEICAIMEERIRAFYPTAEICGSPVADGGEGSVDAFLSACGGEKRRLKAHGPWNEEIEAFYGLIDGGKTAVVEMAACAGLPLAEGRLDPSRTTTFGAGELILDAARRGAKKIIVALGGSATNDLGAGAAAAAGVRFFDAQGVEFVPVGGTLSKIARIDSSALAPELKNCRIITMCDIDNPLYGENGTAYVFAPQKGADSAMVKMLDGELRAAASVIKAELKIDVAQVPGAGAAGGMGAGMIAFFGATLQMGIETVLDAVNFDGIIKDADCIFTGEGKIDGQSLRGKVVIGVAGRAKKFNIPVIAVVGDIGDNIEDAYGRGVSAIFSINRVSQSFAENRKRCKSDLKLTMDNLMRFIKTPL